MPDKDELALLRQRVRRLEARVRRLNLFAFFVMVGIVGAIYLVWPDAGTLILGGAVVGGIVLGPMILLSWFTGRLDSDE
jgi:cell division protein FtsW (lipid II flippase)